MDIIQKIKGYELELTGSELKVYRKIMEDPSVVTTYTISQIAMMADTSTAAVLRFCQHVGFRGFKDFRYEIMTWQREHDHSRRSEDTVSLMSRECAEAIRSLDSLNRDELNALCGDILHAGKVIILGRHRTSTAADKLRMNLTDLGITAVTGTDTLAFQHLLYIIDADTCVIMFSTTGEVSDQEEFLKQLTGQTKKIWLITAARSAKMSSYASHTVIIPTARSGHTFAGSQVIMMALSDIITVLCEECQSSGNPPE